MDKISILNKEFNLTHNTLFYLGEIKNFDPSLLVLDYYDNIGFEIMLSVSIDNQNYSTDIKIEDFDLSIINAQNILDYYVKISFIMNKNMKINDGFMFNHNIDNTNYRIKLKSIKYNDDILEEVVKIVDQNHDILIEDASWNFYDNQKNNVDYWLEQCRAINDIYGHVCVYFKTNTVEAGTNNILSNNFLRDITAVKKFRISFPQNNLPYDKIIYSEWDMMLDGDFVCHVIDKVFKQVFGEYEIPTSKDFIYLPITNKLFRVSSVQPKNGMMNVIGWWEVYLSKFEDDETINFSEEIHNALGITPKDELSDFVSDFNEYVQDTNLDKEYIDELQTEEKKDATQGYTNKLVDKDNYIDVKETENQRSFYSKRLKIVSLNPDSSAFPITMYDCKTVDKRVIAITYDLVDATSLNKFGLVTSKSIKFDYDYVLLGRFQGEVFDIEDKNGNIYITLENNYTKLSIYNHNTQESKEFGFKFEKDEYYNVSVNYNLELNQLDIKVYKLKNKIKTKVFEDIFIFSNKSSDTTISKLYLYGGNYYVGDIKFYNNDNKIIHDYVNPILKT